MCSYLSDLSPPAKRAFDLALIVIYVTVRFLLKVLPYTVNLKIYFSGSLYQILTKETA